MADPDWRGGRYIEAGVSPRKGLAVARMAAHITYLSEEALHRKFGRNLQDRDKPTFGFDADFQIESYLRHQGSTFVDRFDANSYLYMTRAMDYFDLAADHGGRLANAFLGTKTRFCVASFTSDWLFPDGGEQGGGARPQRRRRQRLLRRDRDRPRPRRLPARRAGAVRDRQRLPVRRGRSTGHRQMNAPGNGFTNGTSRVDLIAIAELVAPGSRVLDIGCGDGQLLKLLEVTRNVDGRGIEISQKGVNESVARGLSVVQGDADTDLVDYPDDGFDFVILSQTLQATHRPRHVVEQMLRIGGKAIVSFPNFGHWRVRTILGFTGRMPVTRSLPSSWYETPNIHFCTIRDFVDMCAEIDARIEQSMVLNRAGGRIGFSAPLWFWNLFGQQAVFLLSR